MLKKIIKRLLLIIAIIITSPLILVTWLEKVIEYDIIHNKRGYVFTGCREILSLIPTVIGNYLRLGYYFSVCTSISPDANISFGTMLGHREIVMGPNVNMGPYLTIGLAVIEENVIFGPGVSIVSGKYQHGRPDQRAGGADETLVEENQVIRIGSNSWIGQDAVILASIGKNCTVGAGSVVFKDVPDKTTVIGNPAKKVNL
jgi:virginiamycin A acetyltransferase